MGYVWMFTFKVFSVILIPAQKSNIIARRPFKDTFGSGKGTDKYNVGLVETKREKKLNRGHLGLECNRKMS